MSPIRRPPPSKTSARSTLAWVWSPMLNLAVAPAFFALGYVLQRFVIQPASHGRDENILLVTLGLAIIIDNLALWL